MIGKNQRVQVVAGGDPSRVQLVQYGDDGIPVYVESGGDLSRVIPVQVVSGRDPARVPVIRDLNDNGPVWLPANAIAYADFVNGHYYFAGAEHTLAEMFEQNLNNGPFNVASVVAGEGLQVKREAGVTTSAAANPSMTDAAAASLLPSGGGMTVVMQWTWTETDCGFSTGAYITDEGYNNPCQLVLKSAGYGGDGGLDANNGSDVIAAIAVGTHKAALTCTTARLSASIDGGAVATTASPTMDVPHDLIAWSSVANGAGTGTFNYTSLTFYEPVADAGLPALSA